MHSVMLRIPNTLYSHQSSIFKAIHGHFNPGSFNEKEWALDFNTTVLKGRDRCLSWIRFRMILSCAVTQAVNWQPLTTEVQVQSQGSLCVWWSKMYWGRVLSKYFGFPPCHLIQIKLHTHISFICH